MVDAMTNPVSEFSAQRASGIESNDKTRGFCAHIRREGISRQGARVWGAAARRRPFIQPSLVARSNPKH